MKADDPDGGHPARARDVARDRRPAQAPGRRRRAWPAASTGPRCSSCSASRVAATRTSRRSTRFDDVEPWASAPMTGDEVRALCLSLPEVDREGDLGRRRARRATRRSGSRDKIFVIMADDGAGGSIRTAPASRPTCIARLPRRGAGSPPTSGGYGWVDVEFAGDPRRGPARDHRGRLGADRPEARRRGMAGRADDDVRPRDPTPRRGAVRHERHGRGAAHRGRLRARPRRRPRRAHPVRRRRVPDAETSVEIALAAADAGADLLEVGLPY